LSCAFSRIEQVFSSNTSASSGLNSRLIYSIDKPNVAETKASISVDEYITLVVYHQYNQFMDYFLNTFTKKFKFKFKFEGSEFFNDKETRLDNAMALLDKGIVLPQKIASALNMDVADFQRQLDMARAEDWVSKLTPIVTAYTMSKDDRKSDTGGRPLKKDKDLEESAQITREHGSNDEKES
jgi:hypothetical protein